MKKKNLINEEFHSWVKNLGPFPGFDDLYIKWYESSKYLRNVWECYKEKFNQLYKHIEDSPMLINNSDFSKEELMVEMFGPIAGHLERNFYTLYKNYEEKDEYIPWLDKNGNQIYDSSRKPLQLVKKVKVRDLEDYIISVINIRNIVNSHFYIPNLLVAILKNNKDLFEFEKQKAKRHVLKDFQFKRYKRIIELWVQIEKYGKPKLQDIVDKIFEEENYKYNVELYDPFRTWRRNHNELYHNLLKEYRKKSNN